MKLVICWKREGWKVYTFTENYASETELKKIQNPGVLHIATHGFFKPEGNLNSLARSGLILSI